MRRAIARSQARGSWQRGRVDLLLSQDGCPSPPYGGWRPSFHNLLARLHDAGATIYRRPGALGGEWTARYFLVPDGADAPPKAERLTREETELVRAALRPQRSTLRTPTSLGSYGADEANGAACRAMAAALRAAQDARSARLTETLTPTT